MEIEVNGPLLPFGLWLDLLDFESISRLKEAPMSELLSIYFSEGFYLRILLSIDNEVALF